MPSQLAAITSGATVEFCGPCSNTCMDPATVGMLWQLQCASLGTEKSRTGVQTGVIASDRRTDEYVVNDSGTARTDHTGHQNRHEAQTSTGIREKEQMHGSMTSENVSRQERPYSYISIKTGTSVRFHGRQQLQEDWPYSKDLWGQIMGIRSCTKPLLFLAFTLLNTFHRA